MMTKFEVLTNYINLLKCPTQILYGNETMINIGDYWRKIIEKKFYHDKMIPKYSNETYEIIEVNKINVTVNDNGKNKTIKKDNLKIVNNIAVSIEGYYSLSCSTYKWLWCLKRLAWRHSRWSRCNSSLQSRVEQ